MEMKELWERAQAAIKEGMSPLTYRTLIETNLSPVSLEDDTLILEIAMEPVKGAMGPYMHLIEQSLTKTAGRPVAAEVLTRAEIDRREKEGDSLERRAVSLIPKYTFDTFVVGSGNRFAHAASVAVAENPAEVYNPLFIYGGVGLGKTHLMHAIGHRVHELYPEKRLVYITSETFTNELIAAIQQGRNVEFRNRFRNVDILMVDDIQFIAGRESTQEEFFHTFNALHNAGKQIILTSDRPPQDISRLEERLRSRFAWGLIADIQRPDLDTRIAILRERTREQDIAVPDSVLELIAVNTDSNIRELEGNLNRLTAYANLTGQPITEELCRTALRDLFEKKERTAITAEGIMKAVCEYFSISVEDLVSPSRRREITVPRQIAMYLTREMTGMSLPQIGQAFGGRDHTTVLHSCSQVNAAMKTSPQMQNQVADLKQRLGNQ